jgi:hypothetical protein
LSDCRIHCPYALLAAQRALRSKPFVDSIGLLFFLCCVFIANQCTMSCRGSKRRACWTS